jgi:membrane-bound metal-dependent hydrolase YbcI (DUF457 family)
MPSPVGHALAGYAVGALIAGKPTLGTGARLWPPPPLMIGWAALGCAPDLDLLFGAHSMYTHSVGAALVVALALAALRVPLRLVVASFVVYLSHPLLDALGYDTNPPLGIMAFWPFSSDYYISPVALLTPVSRRFDWEFFWSHNLKVVTSEILIFGTAALLVYRFRSSRSGAEALAA